MVILKLMLVLGIAGHAINMYCDRIISIFPNGKLTLERMKEIGNTEKMARLMDGVSPELPIRSAIWGALSLLLQAFGYLAISVSVYQYSRLFGAIMAAAALLFVVMATAHHVIYCLAEWSFLRLGRTKQGTDVMLDLIHCTTYTRVCYAGYLVYVITLIAAVLSGVAAVPAWMALFTTLPLYIALFPFRIIGTLHIAAILSLLCWMAFI